jgi:Xaa-Pro aminopeptidase
MTADVRLHYAASEHDADQLYATGFFCPDPFLWWSRRGQSAAVFSPLEVDRARREARVDTIHPTDHFLPKSARRRDAAALILAVAKAGGFRRIIVPAQFPAGLADRLRRDGLGVKCVPGPFFPERAMKARQEIEAVRHAVRLAENGLARGLEVLKAGTIDSRGFLRWRGKALTSEIVRGEIDAAIIRQGGLPAGTIVAGGEQACDPHERGSGPLRAHRAIILDIFPRDQKTGYFGDLTRTVVRGTAGDALRNLYRTVADGKRWVMTQMKPGVDGKKLHAALVERFTRAGYPTGLKNGRWTGFFHGTGHGLGLEIHEAPRFSDGPFQKGMVITVEPGLYYPGLGGVRLEDVVVLRSGGIENLTRASQRLEI